MKKKIGEYSEFSKFQNIRANININMVLKAKDIKKNDEAGFEDVREISIEKNIEFGINDLGNKTGISFEFGSIKIGKKEFTKALKRYFDRNEFIQKLDG